MTLPPPPSPFLVSWALGCYVRRLGSGNRVRWVYFGRTKFSVLFMNAKPKICVDKPDYVENGL